MLRNRTASSLSKSASVTAKDGRRTSGRRRRVTGAVACGHHCGRTKGEARATASGARAAAEGGRRRTYGIDGRKSAWVFEWGWRGVGVCLGFEKGRVK
ncbi:hypothetical protein V6N13_065144 [Hibiscus sabdariffa]